MSHTVHIYLQAGFFPFVFIYTVNKYIYTSASWVKITQTDVSHTVVLYAHAGWKWKHYILTKPCTC